MGPSGRTYGAIEGAKGGWGERGAERGMPPLGGHTHDTSAGAPPHARGTATLADRRSMRMGGCIGGQRDGQRNTQRQDLQTDVADTPKITAGLLSLKNMVPLSVRSTGPPWA